MAQPATDEQTYSGYCRKCGRGVMKTDYYESVSDDANRFRWVKTVCHNCGLTDHG